MPLINIQGYRLSGPTDTYAGFTTMLLHAEGADGGKVFVNNGLTKTEYAFQGTAVTSTEQKRFGSSSFKFTGQGYLDAYDAGTQLDSGDFTIECWIFPTAHGNCNIISRWQNQSYIFGVSNGALAFAWAPYSTGVSMLVAGAVPLNTWSHVAVTRKDNIWRLFLNGVQTATREFNVNATSNNFVRTIIGSYTISGYASDGPFYGYIDELRVTKGFARYEGDFVTPTEVFPNP